MAITEALALDLLFPAAIIERSCRVSAACAEDEVTKAADAVASVRRAAETGAAKTPYLQAV